MYKENFLNAMDTFTKAINIKQSNLDIEKEKEIAHLSKKAIKMIAAMLNKCKTQKDITEMVAELGLPYTEKEIGAMFKIQPQRVVQVIFNDIQNLIQTRTIPITDYKILDTA